ncbi:MAG TPA: hypothetical protein VKW78_19015 [Terriglobales bacterium]|nr:hypothetical protein [Terriglobales bacterium]
MQQFGKAAGLLSFIFILGFIGCGGGSVNLPSSVFISPPDDTQTTPYAVTNTTDTSGNSIHLAGSLNYGDVLLLAGTVFGNNGTNVANATVSWSSSNNTLLTVSSTLPSGYGCPTQFQGCTLLCAGTWDSGNIDCIPPAAGTPGGSVTVTAKSGAASNQVIVYVHPKVDKVVISPPTGGCVSLGSTAQLAATAYSGSTVLPSSGAGDVVGPMLWQVTTNAVAAFNKASPNGVITTVAPGTTTVVASLQEGLPFSASLGSQPTISISSTPMNFVTCPIASIHVYVAASGASSVSTTVAPSGTSQLAADVFDSNGSLITNAPLQFYSSQPAAATVASSGLVTGVSAGTSSIIAACSGTGCNIGLTPVYSNVVTASVTGSTSTTIYALNNGGTSLMPISTGSNAVGTAVTLPNAANSLVFNRAGTKAYLGSAAGVMIFDPVANSVGVLAGPPVGQVIGVSPDGSLVVTYNTANNLVQILNVSGSASATAASFAVGAVPRVGFSPDGQKTFITAGSALYVFTTASNPLGTIPLSAPATDVSFLPQGSFAYFAGGLPGAVTVRTTCDNTQADSKAVPGTPQLVASVPDGSRVLVADSPGIDILGVSTTNVGCPPPLTDSGPTSVNFGLGAFTAQQMLVLPNSSKAYILTNLPQILVYDLVANTASTITLANSAQPLNLSSTLDSSTLYVGGSDNAVHVINTGTGTDSAQVPLTFTPNFLAVRP